MNNCPSQSLLQSLLDEALSDGEARSIAAHVEQCSTCQVKLEQMVGDDAANVRVSAASSVSMVDEMELAFLERLRNVAPPVAMQPCPDTDDERASSLTPDSSATDVVEEISFPDPPTPLGPLGRLERFHVESVLGVGSFGVVYRCYDDKLERQVALKVLRPEAAASLSERRRFEREVRRAASVPGDHIVTPYHVGDASSFSLPYFVMELVEGEPLGERLARSGPLPVPEAVDVVRQVALGLAAAHEAGLVHRDVKVSNVLVEASSGRAKIADFGLARQLDVSDDRLTRSNAIVGTPAYMSPEHVESPEQVNARSDVYSLGVVFYELLTGEAPFRGQLHSMLQQLIHDDPLPPRKLNDKIPRDVENVILKCLEKEPGRRYKSARALAEDLSNWSDGRPVAARPIGRARRLWRWCRRYPLPSAAVLTVFLTITTALLLVTRAYRSEAAAHQSEQFERRKAEDERRKAQQLANTNGVLAAKNERLAQKERAQRLAAQRESAVRILHQGFNVQLRDVRVSHGLVVMAEALNLAKHAEDNDLENAIRLNLSDWGSRLIPLRRVFGHRQVDVAQHVGLSDNDTTIATAGTVSTEGSLPKGRPLESGIVRLWDVQTGKLRTPPLRFESSVPRVRVSPDGRTVLVSEFSRPAMAHLIDAHSGREQCKPIPHDWSLGTFSPDGKLVALREPGGVQLRDAPTGKTVGAPLVHKSVSVMQFSADGKQLVTGGWDKRVRFWDPRTGKLIGEPLEHKSIVDRLEFSRDGRFLVVLGRDLEHPSAKEKLQRRQYVIRLWRMSDGRPPESMLTISGPVHSFHFSPHGTQFAMANQETVELWDLRTRERRRPTLKHTGLMSFAYSPSGDRLVTVSEHSDVRIWSTQTGKPFGLPLLQPARVRDVKFSRDGASLHVACVDGIIRVFDLTRPMPGDEKVSIDGSTYCSTFSRDGNLLLLGLGSGAIVIDPTTGKRIGRPLNHPSAVIGVAFRPDPKTGARIAWTCGLDGSVRRWEVGSGKLLGVPLRNPKRQERLTGFAASPDGQFVAAVRDHRVSDSGAWVWRTATGELVADLKHDNEIRAISFSPDGNSILTGERNGKIHVWDFVAEMDRIEPLELPAGQHVYAAAFSPDGKAIATGGGRIDSLSGELCLWDAGSGQLRWQSPFKGYVTALVFRADGKTILAGSADGTARVCETAGGTAVGPDLVHRAALGSVDLSTDGRRALTAGSDGAQLWDVKSGQPIGPRRLSSDLIPTVAFRPDGKWCFAGAFKSAHVALWSTPSVMNGDPDRLVARFKKSTGTHYTEQGLIFPLDPEEWQAVAVDVEPKDRLVAWYRRRAKECAQTDEWIAAQWYLQHLPDNKAPDARFLVRRARAAFQLGQNAAAERDLTAALDKGAKESGVWRLRGETRRMLKRWDDALKDLDAAVDCEPDAWENWNARAELHLARGHWDKAAEDLKQASARRGAPLKLLASEAVIRLHQGKSAEYQQICAMLLQRPERGDDLDDAARIAWVCSLGPRPDGDVNLPVGLARMATFRVRGSYVYARSLGAALYRQGKFRDAIAQLTAAAKLRSMPSPSVWLLLAMAHHQMGEHDQAKQWLEKARSWIDDARRKRQEKGEEAMPLWQRVLWSERLALTVLWKEAESLIMTSARDRHR